jgi:hypothetical protein
MSTKWMHIRLNISVCLSDRFDPRTAGRILVKFGMHVVSLGSNLMVTVKGWYRTKRPMRLRPFSDLVCSSSPIHPTRFSALVAEETPNSESGRNWGRNGSSVLPISVSVILKGSLTYGRVLRHVANGFTAHRRKSCCGFVSPLKSIASYGFEPANLGYSGNRNNHYTAENDWCHNVIDFHFLQTTVNHTGAIFQVVFL